MDGALDIVIKYIDKTRVFDLSTFTFLLLSFLFASRGARQRNSACGSLRPCLSIRGVIRCFSSAGGCLIFTFLASSDDAGEFFEELLDVASCFS